MPPVGARPTGKAYWRSLEEYADTPEFREKLEKEFPHLFSPALSPATRRRFLQLMGASLGLAAAGCGADPNWPRWPRAKILPHAYRPPGENPGTPLRFATSMELGGVAKPLLVTSYDGRPIKVEGNPEHPASGGAADAFAQASVLELYDPDRSRGVARLADGTDSTVPWEAFYEEFRPVLAKLESSRFRGFAVLSEASSSPTLAEVRSRLVEKFPQLAWHEYEPLTRDHAREGSFLAFKRVLRSHYHLGKADVTVSLDDDFLMTHPNAIAHARAFASRRRAEDAEMSRLYMVESVHSITGSQADDRHAVAPGGVAQVAWALAARVVLEQGVELPPEYGYVLKHLRKAARHVEHLAFVAPMAADLAQHRGRGLVAVGPAQPPGVHVLGHILNLALGNTGTTLTYTPEVDSARDSHVDSLKSLVRAMSAGRVDTLLILGGNPVHDAPADLAFPEALGRVAHSAHLAFHRNETSLACEWHLPRAHALEAWSDARSWDGTYTLAQPLVEPLYQGKTPAEFLASLIEDTPVDGRELVRSTFDRRFGSPTDADWKRAVHDGFVAGSGWRGMMPELWPRWKPQSADFEWQPPAGGTVDVVFLQDLTIYDGRFANNGWLQELPDPMTKLTWDNAALIDPVTARDLGISPGDMVRLTREDRTLELPAFLMPGQAPGCIAVSLGYGRPHGGRVATSTNAKKEGGGFDVYPFRTSGAMHVVAGVGITKGSGRYALVSTQDHHAIFHANQGKEQAQRLPDLYREATLAAYREHPDFAKHAVHHPPLESLWEEHSYDTGHRWGMAIDLSACTGCSACVVACQAENNTAIVGKAEVAVGREMHWIRVDRYFHGEPDAPRASHQAVTCHHCENAPCEQVCPVAATVHSREGLNDMVYNRCIGTRYCLNNCPYKVRRFNWFNNQDRKYNDAPLFKMQHNPDVTVRARGVMEKCTYCVQRIKAVTIPAKNDGRRVKDGEIVPACAQTCPTQAIAFGDLNDPDSLVRRLRDRDRAYAMLAELNVKPRTFYLAKIRNPSNPDGETRPPHAAAPDPGAGTRG